MSQAITDTEAFRELIRNALREDVGAGDHSTLSCIPGNVRGKAILKVKEDCILAGMEVARAIFYLDNKNVNFQALKKDGDQVSKGEEAFVVESSIEEILKKERLVLNCMQRMSGIASLTRQYTRKLEGYHTQLLDTRKTTPNFRLLEKEAVRIGGGINHRFGLYDMIMLKDNHIDFCGGLEKAVNLAHQYVTEKEPGLKIEVETRSLADVKILLETGIGKVFRVMLDNFQPAQVKEAVAMVNGAMETEASGGINLDNLEAYAATNVDYVSVGGLVHQARSVDLSLKAKIGNG